MAMLINKNSGMTTADIRALTPSPSWKGIDVFIDALGNEHDIEHEADTNFFDVEANESIVETVRNNEKDALLQRRSTEGFEGGLRASGKGEEWDHLIFALSKEETKALSELGEDAQNRLKDILIEFLGGHPDDSNARRMAMYDSHLHMDTGKMHFHIVTHRHAHWYDDEGNLKRVSKSIQLGKPQLFSKVAEKLEEKLHQAGFGDIITDVDSIIGDRSLRRDTNDPRNEPLGKDIGKSTLGIAKELSVSSKTMQRLVNSLNQQEEKLERELYNLRAQKEDAINFMAAEVQIAELTERAEKAEASLKIREAERLELIEAKNKAENDSKELRQSVTSLEEDVDELTQTAEAQEKKLFEANSNLGTALDKITELEEETTDLHANLKDAKQELETATSTISNFEAKQAEEVARIEAAHAAEIKELKTENSSLSKLVKELKEQVNSLTASFASVYEQAEQKAKELFESKTSKENKELRERIAQLEAAAPTDEASVFEARQRFTQLVQNLRDEGEKGKLENKALKRLRDEGNFAAPVIKEMVEQIKEEREIAKAAKQASEPPAPSDDNTDDNDDGGSFKM